MTQCGSGSAKYIELSQVSIHLPVCGNGTLRVLDAEEAQI